MHTSPTLPQAPLDPLRTAFLSQVTPGSRLVLTAQAGSGKSSRVPLWLREMGLTKHGRILLLEPRRLAAQTLATYLATLLGEELGQHIGLRMRGVTITSQDCDIEVVTEGVFTRMLLADPELRGVSCVIFDEFHERSIASDLGLTLVCDIQKALREDLLLLLMSATIDWEDLQSKLHDFQLLTFDAQGYPVDVHWLEPPKGTIPGSSDFLRYVARVTGQATKTQQGTILVFLPGAYEIARVGDYLRELLPDTIPLQSLTRHSSHETCAAIFHKDPQHGCQVVLASSVAESAVTIPHVTCVIDCGLARRQVHDPGQGLDRLVTMRESLASMLQRTGRAGRTSQGTCLRLFSEAQAADFPKHVRPEILRADLSGLVLVLAAMGIVNYEAALALPWLDAPPKGSFMKARELLQKLGALDKRGHITSLGKKMSALPLSPRAALLLVKGKEMELGALACVLAALIEHFWRLGAKSADIRALVEDTLHSPASSVMREALRLARLCGISCKHLASIAQADLAMCGRLLLCAWPDFLAMRMTESTSLQANHASYKLCSGHMLSLDGGDPCAQSLFLVAPCVLGSPPRERIRLCAPLAKEDLSERMQDRCEEVVTHVTKDGLVQSFRLTSIEALEIARSPIAPQPTACRKALCAYLAQKGTLPLGKASRLWQERVLFLHAHLGEPWPDISDARLLACLDDWLGPLLESPDALAKLSDTKFCQHLSVLLPPKLHQELERLAPTFWLSPAKVRHPIHYERQGKDISPWVEVKLQECFGLLQSPQIAGDVPLTLHLTSPAGRPLQITRDLASFWRDGYLAVRGEMLGRYPKHPWPSDPINAPASFRTKKAEAARTKTSKRACQKP